MLPRGAHAGRRRCSWRSCTRPTRRMNAPSVSCPAPRLPHVTVAPARRRRSHGLTLLEVLLALAVLGVLASVALPNYSQYMERGRVAQAMADMRTIELTIFRFSAEQNGRFPESLAEIGAIQNDPWGRPYQYLNVMTTRKSRPGAQGPFAQPDQHGLRPLQHGSGRALGPAADRRPFARRHRARTQRTVCRQGDRLLMTRADVSAWFAGLNLRSPLGRRLLAMLALATLAPIASPGPAGRLQGQPHLARQSQRRAHATRQELRPRRARSPGPPGARPDDRRRIRRGRSAEHEPTGRARADARRRVFSVSRGSMPLKTRPSRSAACPGWPRPCLGLARDSGRKWPQAVSPCCCRNSKASPPCWSSRASRRTRAASSSSSPRWPPITLWSAADLNPLMTHFCVALEARPLCCQVTASGSPSGRHADRRRRRGLRPGRSMARRNRSHSLAAVRGKPDGRPGTDSCSRCSPRRTRTAATTAFRAAFRTGRASPVVLAMRAAG
jgi:prepilin-type N-terminal cleavage/methylation domain-containing protein